MLELAAALPRILAAVQPLPSETIALADADGRILAADIDSPIDLPPFDNSAMDGYAVRSADFSGVTLPVELRLAGKVAAGEWLARDLHRGECVRIFTGSPLPPGADAVVMQEDTDAVPDRPDRIVVREPVRPRENARLRGEDVRAGTRLAAAGEKIMAGHIGLLAATGHSEVRVGARPVVGLLATGSELQPAGLPLAPGKIYESNRAMLAALIARAGGRPRVLPLVPDTLDATRAGLEAAFSGSDVVVTSGGVSVGEMDFVKAAFTELGGTLEFWKVAIKPGKPFVLGRWRDKILFGLPGNPVSAFVTFLLLVRPAILRLQGATDVELPTVPGVLAEPLANRADRRHFMRVSLESDGQVRSAGPQASHVLGSLAEADGLVDVPARTSYAAGVCVKVSRWP